MFKPLIIIFLLTLILLPNIALADIDFINWLDFETVDEVLTSLLNYLRGTIIGVAIVFIVIAGIFYMVSGGDERKIESAKKALTAAGIGLAIAMASPIFVKEIAIILDWPTVPDLSSVPRLATILLRVANFLLAIIGMLAIIFMIIGGINYLISAGDENRMQMGKRMFYYSIIGLTIALGALVIVRTVTVLLQG